MTAARIDWENFYGVVARSPISLHLYSHDLFDHAIWLRDIVNENEDYKEVAFDHSVKGTGG